MKELVQGRCVQPETVGHDSEAIKSRREEVARIIDGVAFRPPMVAGPFKSETEKEKWLRRRNVAYFTAERILEREVPVRLTWDNLDPDGKPWTYPRAELLFGRISLGQYSEWAKESLRRDGLDCKKPIHAWITQAPFIGGEYNDAPRGWFDTAEGAKAFVEREARAMIAAALNPEPLP